ncbi:DUF262 domain-containing protein [Pseudodesulfovibrio sp.]|uniref:DUF262 domain-containing protein n=1 Tax=unclassified Pseudodesulfovibrio TaxID=2661612 RepID=UPI003B0027E0
MERKTLLDLFAGSLYQIPDYQRGYAWEEKQLDDFIQDIDAIVDEDMASHYTGTVVVYAPKEQQRTPYGITKYPMKDIVDGQQRLTTSCLYLSVIINELKSKDNSEFEQSVKTFLYSGVTCKLTLNNGTGGIFCDLLKNGSAQVNARSPHEKRLITAYHRFRSHLDNQLKIRGDHGSQYLLGLYEAITQKLNFTFYTIEEECEIGMTFELMNSRGKGLSVLELLKNYLMYWISRNLTDESERKTLTDLINKNWRDAYINLGTCNGDEDQCLRVAWVLFCSHTPKNWKGYEGFKQPEYIPLRVFSDKRPKEKVAEFIELFAHGLAEISKHYAKITNPTEDDSLSKEEFLWLSKIHRTGNIANFLPLMVAARRHREKGIITEEVYVGLLKVLECYAYRVFLFEGKRSNAGQSSLYKCSHAVFHYPETSQQVVEHLYRLIRVYSDEKDFNEYNSAPNDWYSSRRCLKYTLFEYELYLLSTEGKGQEPLLPWKQLSDSTIEHILPQTPEKDSHWMKVWPQDSFDECLHDIGNLVLTKNNSNYKNFDFDRKKGKPGFSPSYTDSGIKQERKVAQYVDWTPEEFRKRRNELISWIDQRWQTIDTPSSTELEVNDEEDDD